MWLNENIKIKCYFVHRTKRMAVKKPRCYIILSSPKIKRVQLVFLGDIGIAANVEAIREAQEAMANASGENAAVMFDKAIQNMRNEIGQTGDFMFNAVAAAVNMQQEKASINSGDRAAAFHDEHADGEKDDLPGKSANYTCFKYM
jgi:hypothetical protein